MKFLLLFFLIASTYVVSVHEGVQIKTRNGIRKFSWKIPPYRQRPEIIWTVFRDVKKNAICKRRQTKNSVQFYYNKPIAEKDRARNINERSLFAYLCACFEGRKFLTDPTKN